MFTIVIAFTIATIVLGYEIIQLQHRVQSLETTRLINQRRPVTVPSARETDDYSARAEARIEEFLSRRINTGEFFMDKPRHLVLVTPTTPLLDDEDPLALYADAGIVVSTH